MVSYSLSPHFDVDIWGGGRCTWLAGRVPWILVLTCWSQWVIIKCLSNALWQENSGNHLEEDKKAERSETVDLNDNTLQVDISDALSEREKVKFTVHTKVIFFFTDYRLTLFEATFLTMFESHVDFLEGICKVWFLSGPSTWRIYLAPWSIWGGWSICRIYCKFIFISSYSFHVVTFFFRFHLHLQDQILTALEKSCRSSGKEKAQWLQKSLRRWNKNLRREYILTRSYLIPSLTTNFNF